MRRPTVAFGPVRDGFGSWEWVGVELAEALSPYFDVTMFRDDPPKTQAAVFVKFPPPTDWLPRLESTRIIYCPVDFFGSAKEIDQYSSYLACCSAIIIHSHRLRKYFRPYAPVEYLDHHIRFATPNRRRSVTDGPLLYVGVTSNLPPVVEWINRFSLPRDLILLTNHTEAGDEASVKRFGISQGKRVQVLRWSPSLQIQLQGECSAAIDIRGSDFRARHKPPTKAMDFLASGIPVALSASSSTADHLRFMGFEPAILPGSDAVSDSALIRGFDRLFSAEYVSEAGRFGAAIAELNSLPRIALRMRRLIDGVLGGGTDRLL